MKLTEFYLGEAGLTLVPIEHLSDTGMSKELAALLSERRAWGAARIEFFDRAFALYWQRSSDLARRTPTWPAPRRRNIALLAEPLSIRPHAQLLNTSSWTLYESDFDPEGSHPEFAAYLLAHGDRMALTGEVTGAAVQNAAWWFERSDDECAAFSDAVARALRPDAAAYKALAAAIPWLRQLRHETLRPPEQPGTHRGLPGTGLLVPRALEREPPALAARWKEVATAALASYRARWSATDADAVRSLSNWLISDTPPLVVTEANGGVLWDPERASETSALESQLGLADAAALRAITADLELIAQHTRTFLAALVNPGALPAPAADGIEAGYTYLHPERRLLAYNLQEPGMERFQGPPLPYAHEMLGARSWHEWAHAADAAGWVPCSISEEGLAGLKASFAEAIEDTIAEAPHTLRAAAAKDLLALAAERAPGEALTELLLKRMPDYRANLVARRFMSTSEAETYVRHNIRTLRPDYPARQLWRMLIRYLYEFQYLGPALGLTAIPDPYAYFVHSTSFYQDFLASGVLDEKRFAELSEAVARICSCYEVDETRFRAA